MADQEIVDIIINGYFTFEQYGYDIDMIACKILKRLKDKFTDKTLDELLEIINIVYVSEGFQMISLTNDELINMYNTIYNSVPHVHSFIQMPNYVIHSHTYHQDLAEGEESDEELYEDETEDDVSYSSQQSSPSDIIHNSNSHQNIPPINSNIADGVNLYNQYVNNFENRLDEYINRMGQLNLNSESNIYNNYPMVINFLGLITGISNNTNNFFNEKVNVVFNKQKLDSKFVDRKYENIDEKTKNINENCPICLDKFNPDDTVKEITCNHVFHSECITEWLTKENYNCPVCRKEVGSREDLTIINN